MRAWYLTYMGQQAFYNSPRARWLLKLLGAVGYFLVFLQVSGGLGNHAPG